MSFFEHSQRQKASERAFSSIVDAKRLRSEPFRAFSAPGIFGAIISEHLRRQETSERAFSKIVDAREASERAFSKIVDAREGSELQERQITP